jgi:hypothetical protein
MWEERGRTREHAYHSNATTNTRLFTRLRAQPYQRERYVQRRVDAVEVVGGRLRQWTDGREDGRGWVG